MMPQTIDVCVCTYKRAHLADTLRTIFAQTLPKGLAMRVIVADNDTEPSAQAMVEDMASHSPCPVTYVHAPERNISIARNACLDHADGDWVAFIDDDEIAPPGWLSTLWQTASDDGVDVIFGPAIAVYPDGTPDWIRQGDYHTNRVPIHGGKVSTGHTCNVLMRWSGSAISDERFLLEKGRTGGEDVEFFFRLSRAGLRLGNCDAAEVFETTAEGRLTYPWIRTRRFAAGQFHGAHSWPPGQAVTRRAGLFCSSTLKVLTCLVSSAALFWNLSAHRGWIIRACFHAGVCAATLGIRQAELY